jgi:tetratricopeptide (TPR) repeat protein
MLLQKLILQLINYRNHFLFLFLFIVYCESLIAQTSNIKHPTNPTIDSLVNVLGKTKVDSTELKILREIYSNMFALIFNSGSSDYGLVIKYTNDASVLSDRVGNRYEKGQALKMLGQIELEKGNLSESLNYSLSCLKNAEEMGDKACAANQYYGIAVVYDELKNDSLALKYCLISLRMQKEVGITNLLPNTYNRIAGINESRGNYTVALINYKLGLKVARETNYKLFEGVIYKGMGNTYLVLKNYKLASVYLFASLKIMEELNNEFYKTELTNHIGHYYTEFALASADHSSKILFDSSIFYLLKAEKLGRRFNYSRSLIYTYKELSKAYKEVGDYQKALNYLELYVKSNDSLSTAKSKNLITELNKKNEAEKNDLLNKIQKEKNQTEKDNRRRLLSISAVSIFIVTIILLLYYRQRNRKKREIEKAKTLHKMAELELQSLRSQLNPHFMFNSLNSIQELILLEENEKAHSYLSRFGKLIRLLLENAEKPFVPVRKEIDFLELYLALENLRVPDLEYSISTDPKIKTEETFIPNMILQPYIENAIWHGLSNKQNNKQLQIRIYSENGTVNYEIEDNGVGRKKSAELKSLFRQKHQSKGMELLSKRFKLLNEEYSSDINTTTTDVIKNNEVAGTLVTIKVPVDLSKHLQN